MFAHSLATTLGYIYLCLRPENLFPEQQTHDKGDDCVQAAVGVRTIIGLALLTVHIMSIQHI